MKRNPVKFFRWFSAFMLGGILLSDISALAQGTTVLHTGSGSPLTTGSQSVFVPASPDGAWIQLALGFATDENVAPNTFFDSATLTMQNYSASVTAILFTADCSGWYWSPAGGVILPGAIDHSGIPFPDLGPTYSQQLSWLVNVPVPVSMTGQTVNLYLDLFDNQNTVGSLAWMGPATVIPEPSMYALAALGAMLVMRRRFFRI